MYEKEMKVAEKAAREAGKVLMAMFDKNIEKRKKGTGRDFVTEADHAAEKTIMGMIKKNFPDHSILSEEYGSYENSSYRWIIDPLDGTHNFYYGIPIFGTMIAFEHDKDLKFSVIYMPYTKDFCKAVKGKGTFLNGKRVKVSGRTTKAMYTYHGVNMYNKDKKLRNLFHECAMKFSPEIRNYGCAALSWILIAKGAADGTIAYDHPFWDMAPGILSVTEAGGKVTDADGRKWEHDGKGYILSNGKIHDQLLKIAEQVTKGKK